MGGSMRDLSSTWRERLTTVAVWAAPLVVTGVFLLVIGDIVWHGAGSVSWSFLTTAPLDAGRSGGIGPIIVSTLLILAVCLAVSLPLGVATALYLSEFTRRRSRLGRLVRRSLDVLAGVPSIVFGLFGNAFFGVVLGMGFSILSGGLTLACMVLPILIRSTEEGFRAAPDDYRRSAAALGLSRTSTVLHLLLPAAAPGIVVGVVLGVGRALAETAALLFTSGYVTRAPGSLLDSGRALSIHIYDLSMNVAGGNANAYGAALVLLTILIILNVSATWLGDQWLQRRLQR